MASARRRTGSRTCPSTPTSCVLPPLSIRTPAPLTRARAPTQIAELLRRGWAARELEGLTGANLLRVLEGAERVAAQMRAEGVPPASEVWERRTDLPMRRGEF
jgi:hypothetical protein